jgi:holo-[acyl-carrier protein] synthase
VSADGGGGGIVGVGVDAVSVERFRRLLERRPRFAARCFTESEQSDAGSSTDRAQSLAARFAAKEAVMKALGTGIGAFALTDVEVRRTGGKDATRNAPYVVLTGTAAELAGAHGAARFHLSLTHTDDVAIAFVVAEQAAPVPGGASPAPAVASAAVAGSGACAPS